MPQPYQILVATQNTNKLKEFSQLFVDVPEIELLTPVQTTAQDLDPEETGATFSENACIKAEAFARATGLPSIADDSGLIVPELGENFPGVQSKRWFPGTDAQRNQALLEKLGASSDRTAKFVSVLCLYDPATDQSVSEYGEVTGKLLSAPAGNDGFGYDPLFVPDGYTQSFAQLGAEVKNTISHRARAFKAFKAQLLKYLQTKNTEKA